MEFSIETGIPEKQLTDCIIVGVFENRVLSPAADNLDQASGGYITDIITNSGMTGQSASTLLLHKVPGTLCQRILLIGLGKKENFNEKTFCQAIQLSTRTLKDIGAKTATLYLTLLEINGRNTAWRIRQASLLAETSLYCFEQFKTATKTATPCTLEKISLIISEAEDKNSAKKAMKQGVAIAQGVTLTRHLGNLPGNVCTPTYLAEIAQQRPELPEHPCL